MSAERLNAHWEQVIIQAIPAKKVPLNTVQQTARSRLPVKTVTSIRKYVKTTTVFMMRTAMKSYRALLNR